MLLWHLRTRGKIKKENPKRCLRAPMKDEKKKQSGVYNWHSLNWSFSDKSESTIFLPESLFQILSDLSENAEP